MIQIKKLANKHQNKTNYEFNNLNFETVLNKSAYNNNVESFDCRRIIEPAEKN